MTELSRLTCDELIRFVNGVTSTPLEAELLRRLEDIQDDEALAVLDVLDNVDMSPEGLRMLTDAMNNDAVTTARLLNALDKHGIYTAEDLNYTLNKEKEFEEMALEDAVNENTAALKSLEAMLAKFTLPQAIGDKLVESTKENLQAQAPKSAKATPSTGTAKTSPESSAPSAIGASEKPLTYEGDVKPKAIALATKKGAGALTAVLAQFEVDHATKLKPEQYVDVVKAFEEAAA